MRNYKILHTGRDIYLTISSDNAAGELTIKCCEKFRMLLLSAEIWLSIILEFFNRIGQERTPKFTRLLVSYGVSR